MADDNENGQRVTNYRLQRDIMELGTKFDAWQHEIKEWREIVEKRIRILEDEAIERRALDKRERDTKEREEERFVTWPKIKDKLLVPAVQYAIALFLGYLFAKLTGVAP